MATFQTPLGPVELPEEIAEKIRERIRQAYDDGLTTGYANAERMYQRQLSKAPVRPVFVAVDLGTYDLELAA